MQVVGYWIKQDITSQVSNWNYFDDYKKDIVNIFAENWACTDGDIYQLHLFFKILFSHLYLISNILHSRIFHNTHLLNDFP